MVREPEKGGHDMFHLTKKRAGRVGMLIVLGMLILAGASCSCIPGSKEEDLTDLRNALATAESKADAAQQTANEALALAQSASPEGEAVEGEPILLTSGIALTYEHEGKSEILLYPVDAVFVYYTYDEFANEWKDKPNIVVQMAWITSTEEMTWQLVFEDKTLIPSDPKVRLSDVTLTHWHEYVVYTQVGIPTDADPALSSVVVEQGVQQSIDGQYGFDGSASIELLGEMDKVSGTNQPYVQLLLTDTSGGQIEHSLVTILDTLDPEPPGPGDTAGQQHCSTCVWGLCKLSCWWYGW